MKNGGIDMKARKTIKNAFQFLYFDYTNTYKLIEEFSNIDDVKPKYPELFI